MALEIKSTPTLTGSDADRFVKITESESKPVSKEEINKMSSLVKKVLSNSDKK